MLNYQITNQFILVIIACVIGVITALIIKNIKPCSSNMFITLTILPALVCAALLAVNGSLGTSIAILGVFSLVRFRSFPGTSYDITNVFFSMVSGLLISTGYILIALIIIAIILFLILVINVLTIPKTEKYQLTILVPENINFDNIFDDVFSKYFSDVDLIKTKTSNMGTMFETTYSVVPKNDINIKDMLDEIRVKNGNLNISFSKIKEDTEL